MDKRELNREREIIGNGGCRVSLAAFDHSQEGKV